MNSKMFGTFARRLRLAGILSLVAAAFADNRSEPPQPDGINWPVPLLGGVRGGLARSATGFPACGFGRLSSRQSLVHRTAKSYLVSVVELVALRRVAPRPAAQRLPANRAVRASRSAAARGGVVAARQPLPVNRYGKSGKPAGWKACPTFRFM